MQHFELVNWWFRFLMSQTGQVDMKNYVKLKCCKDFQLYFNTLETYLGTVKDRIFEVIRRETNGREFISITYFDLHDGIRTKIDQPTSLNDVIWRSKITILKTDCELHNRNFELNSLQKRMAGPWKPEKLPEID